jgi:hypothetical protein
MRMRRLFKAVLRAASFLTALFTPALAAAQGCALCYTQAANSSNKFIEALRSGILVLVFPPLAISIGIAYLAWRKRNQFNAE